jgi:hypothetical protein|nr:MAG TPA: outer capsid protein sigma-1 attachment protein [Caudoviricetes sp.]
MRLKSYLKNYKIMIRIESFSKTKSKGQYNGGGSSGGGFTTTVKTELEPHLLWGQAFDGTNDVDGDMTTNGSVYAKKTVSGDTGSFNNLSATTANAETLSATTATTTTLSATTANAETLSATTATTTTLSATTANVSKITSDSISNSGIIESNGIKGDKAVINDMSVKNLKVTGSAHFFELIIDKVKSAGGSMLITPADGFDVDIVQDSPNEVKLLWQCQDEDGNQRDNMWKVNDQALCMSFNQAKVGTTHNVANKYYWALVTSVNKTNEPTVIDGVKYNYITLSKTTVDGTLNPEFGDSIVMCGYRGTDDKERQSAIYISAYTSLDNGLKAPLFAQYQGINDFNLQSHRKSYYDAVSAKFIGEFEATDGQNIIDIINNKIAEAEASIKLDTKNIVLSVSEKTKERRNLLKGTTFHRQIDNFFISSAARIEMNSGYNGTNCIKVIDDTDGTSHYIGVYWDGSQGARSIKIEKGKKYTISCYYKTNDTNANFSLEAIYTDKETNAKRLGRPKYLSKNMFNPKYSQWELFTTVIDTTDAESDYIAFNFWEYCNKESGRIEAYICRPMVEEGDTYYGWTVSDEDNDYIGANLIDNSRTFEVGGNTLEAKGTKTLKGDVYELTYEGSDEYNTFYRIDATKFKLDTDYTLSFEARGDAKYIGAHAYYPITKTPYTLLNEAIDNLMYEQEGDGTKEAYTTLLSNSDIEREKKLWVHFKFKKRLPSYIYLQFPKNSDQSGVTSWNATITKPKIEEGANVTQWTEKKTDIDNTITTINSNVATLTQKADSIESKVTSNTTSINTITGQLSSQSSSISKLEQKANSIESKVTSNTTSINNINGQVTTNKTDIANLTIKADGIESTVSSVKDEIIGENCMLGLNGQGWSTNTIYEDAGTSFHCESTDWFQSHPIADFTGDYTFSFGVWGGGIQIKILEFTQTYYDDGIYNEYVDFGLYTPCKILTTSSSVSNATLTNYATSGTSSTWTYTNTETITLAVGDNVAVRVTNNTNSRYNSIYGTVSAINTSSKSVTVKAIALLDQPNTICTLSCPMDKKDGTDINSLHYDEKLGRYWIRFKESSGASKTFVMLFRNPSTSIIGYISRLMIEESVEYPHKYNSTGQASQSMIKQTADSIMMSVNDTYVKIGDGNITLNGDTKVNGSLTLNDENQGFLLLGDSGTTEISPKSIGTYNEFKGKSTNVIKTHYNSRVSGFQSADGNLYGFSWNVAQKLGTFKKGSYIKLIDYTNVAFANVGTEQIGIGTPSATFYIHENGTLTKTITVGDKTSVDIGNYTVVGDNVEVMVTGRFTKNVSQSIWGTNQDIIFPRDTNITIKPIRPMPSITVTINWKNEVPTSSGFMLIGYDGFAVNFGNNKTVYCGADGFIASYGTNEFRITSDGIWRNNHPNVKVVKGTNDSNSPATYTVQEPVDTVLCTGNYCKIIFPRNPYEGQTFRILDKALAETYINSNGKKVVNHKTGGDGKVLSLDYLGGQVFWTYVYIGGRWYESAEN